MFTNSEMRDYQLTLDTIYFGANAKDELSLSKWCDRTRLTAQAAKVLSDDLQTKYESEKSRYSTQENNKRWAETQTEKKAFFDVARAKIERDLDSVLDAKRAAFSKAMSAPDEASVRLLQTLQMREHVSASEIAATVEHLAGNLQALSVLKEIAARNNVLFPRLNSDFLSTEQEVREAASHLLDDIFSDEQKYYTKLFLSESGNNGQMLPYVDALDNPAYLSCDIDKIISMPGEKDGAKEEGGKIAAS